MSFLSLLTFNPYLVSCLSVSSFILLFPTRLYNSYHKQYHYFYLSHQNVLQFICGLTIATTTTNIYIISLQMFFIVIHNRKYKISCLYLRNWSIPCLITVGNISLTSVHFGILFKLTEKTFLHLGRPFTKVAKD